MTRPTEQQPRSGAELAAVLDSMERRAAVEQLRRHSYDLLRLRPGAPVVDGGCGTGRAVAELAARGARAVGIDPAEPMPAIARPAVARRGSVEGRTPARCRWPTGR